MDSHPWLGRPGKSPQPRDARARSCDSAAQPSGAACPRARLALGLLPARAADERILLVSERNRGGRKVTTKTRCQRQLRRDQGHRRVRLSLAHLGMPLIEAMAAAMDDGGGHGGSRPRFGRLRRAHGVSALMACSVSIPNPNCI
jgi:hypothetical protein